MGDPLSATAAVLSLPGIFMSCVQCFELIQTGRNFEKDLLILTTKFSNQQLRFTKWGEACGFGSHHRYNEELDKPELRPHIERTFRSIKILLDDGVSLSKSYGGIEPTDEPILVTQAVSTRWSWTAIKKRLNRNRDSRGTTAATKWALSDKKKLDETIRHLNDLISDLETITKNLGVSERQRYLVQYEIQSISDTETLEIIEASRLSSSDIVADTASIRLQYLSTANHSATQQPGSLLEVLSVADTGDSTATYTTCREELYLDEEPFSTNQEADVAQHKRIMKNLLSGAKNELESHRDLSLDLSTFGKVINCLCFDIFDQVVENHYCELRSHGLSTWTRKRVSKEMRNSRRSIGDGTFLGCSLHFPADNLENILASIEGPVSSPYRGGVFHFVIHISREYPLCPPRCRMLTKVYHPNISPRGEICVSFLRMKEFNPIWDLEKMVLAIASLLDDPNLEDPLVPEIAETYIRDRSLYEANARAYTQKYGCEVSPGSQMAENFVRICKELALEEDESAQ